MAITMALYPLARRGRQALGIERESCVCVGEEWVPMPRHSRRGRASRRA